MRRRLFIECGAAETRASLVSGDEFVGFWRGPARGDEGLARAPETGELFLGRIRTVVKGLRAAFVDIGEDLEAFLPENDFAPLVEGASLIVKVKRPPIAAKGAVISADWRAGLNAAAIESAERAAKTAAPGRLCSAVDAVILAWRLFEARRPASAIIDDVEGAAQFRRHAPKVECGMAANASEFARASDEALAAAFEPVIALDQGGRLVIDETEGPTVIDVDAGERAGRHDWRLAERVNAAAAAVLFQELARRGIGGRIIVDFLPIPDRAARVAFLAALKIAAKDGYECRFGNLSADGLLDLTAPRTRRSLLEEASEPDGSRPRPGRRFTRDWRAKDAIRALENELRAAPSGRPRLLVGSEIADYLEQARPQWRSRLATRFGARFEISLGEKLKGRDVDLVP